MSIFITKINNNKFMDREYAISLLKSYFIYLVDLFWRKWFKWFLKNSIFTDENLKLIEVNLSWYI